MRVGLFLGNVGRNSGGPEVYEKALVHSLAKIDTENEYHAFCLEPRATETIGLKQANFHFHQLRPHVRPVAMTLGLPAMALRHPVDVMHATFMPPVLPVNRYALTLVCFSMFRHPEFYPLPIRLRLQALIRLGMKTARLFLCVSDNVRQLFAETFRIPMDRLAVSYMAASEAFRPIAREQAAARLQELFNIRDPYFLFSGRWEHRKNIVGTLRAFARFRDANHLPHKLVLTGGRSWSAHEAEEVIRELKLEPDVIDLGKTPFEHLPLLYAGAEALVYASLWEGFGMPLAEAMACGTPSITSNVSSMPEIAGDSGLLVDPYSIDEIADAMRRIATETGLRDGLSKAALRRSRLFSWEETAKRSLETYKRLAQAS